MTKFFALGILIVLTACGNEGIIGRDEASMSEHLRRFLTWDFDRSDDPWSDKWASCTEEGEIFLSGPGRSSVQSVGKDVPPGQTRNVRQTYTERPCTPAELAQLKLEYEEFLEARQVLERE